jgi:uncharacterized membrane protein YdjX (TVP38/TMEM64 family)
MPTDDGPSSQPPSPGAADEADGEAPGAPDSPPRLPAGRLIALALLLGAVVCASIAFMHSPIGHHLAHRHDLGRYQVTARSWVHAHPWVSPAAFVLVYALMATLMLLPVWWLQVGAGFCFGLGWGITWCTCGATLGAAMSVSVSRSLIGEWLHERYEERWTGRMARLRDVDQRLGSNGVLVVMAVRLLHVVPFGISNYLFGLTRIGALDAALGTCLGGLPSIWFFAGNGVDPHMFSHWRTWMEMSVVNAVLLIPIGWAWYRRHHRQAHA